MFCILAAAFLSILPVYADSNDAKVYVLSIREDIAKGLHPYLERGIKEAEENNADLIIFDMHTNGGSVDAATDIANTIRNTELKTITFINSKAISAGSYRSEERRVGKECTFL